MRTAHPFYGWWNVLVAFVGMALSYAMFTVFVFGTFLKPLQEEFGWSRGELSLALTMTNIGVVIAAPTMGLMIDRLGVRKVLIPSIILMGFTVASMMFLDGNIWHLYAIYLLVPLLGAGTLPLSYSRVIIAWFSRRRGIALGISLSGFGVGVALMPIFAQWTIEQYGWRVAYAGFTTVILGVSLPLAILMLRESPQEMGLNPDGASSADLQTKTRAPATAPNIGLTGKEATKTGNYWLILTSFLLFGLGVTSILAHLVPMLIDRGLSPRLGALCMTSLGLGLIFGRVLSGYLMDRFFAPYVAAAFLSGFVVGIVILASGASGWPVFVAAVLIGMSSGSEISEIGYIVSRYFGPLAFGQIYGIMFAAFQLGSAFGPPMMGKYYDVAGNYTGALWMLSGIACIATILMFLLQRPYPTLSERKLPNRCEF